MRTSSLILFLPALAASISVNMEFRKESDQNPLLPERVPATCKCTGTNNTGESGKPYICRDPRLGPRLLPKRFPLLSFVSDYDRFGGQAPGEFLAKWTNPETGYYNYPPKNGFYLDINENPIVGNMTLQVGTQVDRFGSESGVYSYYN